MKSFLMMSIIPFIVVLFSAFWAFDTLVIKFHRQYPEEWKSAGRPRGFFWFPGIRGLFSITSFLAMQKLAFTWLFKTPEWIKRDESSLRRLSFLRKAVLIWNLSVLSWASIMVIFTN